MTKIYTKIVNNCYDCPNVRGSAGVASGYICMKAQMPVDGRKIPAFCPLDNYSLFDGDANGF